MSRPAVSIVIPVHNGARWLEPCILSALAQTYAPVEVLAWDDGSTDRSREILAAFGNRITWSGAEKRGGNYARNRLLERATGEWLQFLDADDYLEREKIERQLSAAQDDVGVDVLYSPVWIETWRNGRAVERSSSTVDMRSDLFTQWISWQLPQTGGVLWRASALREIAGWNESLPCCQEHDLYLRSLQAGQRWRFCASPGAVYRVWSEETVCRKDPLRVIRTRTALVDEAVSWLRKNHALTSAHVNAAGRAFFEMARTWAQHDIDGAVEYVTDRKVRSTVQLAGPAAPLSYRLVYRFFGFRCAEQIARRFR